MSTASDRLHERRTALASEFYLLFYALKLEPLRSLSADSLRILDRPLPLPPPSPSTTRATKEIEARKTLRHRPQHSAPAVQNVILASPEMEFLNGIFSPGFWT
jgi:hypothetical protein